MAGPEPIGPVTRPPVGRFGALAALRRQGGTEGTTHSLPMLVNSLALIAGKLATLGAGFLAWVVAARLFDQGDVGLASGAVSAMMLSVQLALFGAGAAVIVLLPRHRDDPAELLDTALTLVAITGTGCALFFLLVARGLFSELSAVASSPAYAVTFVVMAVAGTLGVLLDQVSTALRRGDQALVRGVVSGGVTFGLMVVIPALTGAGGALPILIAWAAGNVAPIIVGVLQLHGTLPLYRFRPRLSMPLATGMTRIGLPNWLLTLTERSPGSILPIVVTELLSPEANAAWYAAWMMAWVVYVVPIQVGLNLFAEAALNPHEARRAVRTGIATSLAVGVAVAAAAAVAGPLMLRVLGHGYADAGARPLRILLVAVLPVTFVQAHFAVCRARGLLTEAIATGLVSGAVGIAGAALIGRGHGLDGMALWWLGVQLTTGAWSAARLRYHVWSEHLRISADIDNASAVRLAPNPSAGGT